MLNRVHIALTVVTLLILILAGAEGFLQIHALKFNYLFNILLN